MNKHIYLASSSPRRAQLLSQMGLDFNVVAADIDEVPQPNERVDDFVVRMALEKARAGRQNTLDPKAWVIAGDTLLAIKGEVIGKPKSKADFCLTMQMLSGSWHEVLSAVALDNGIQEVWALNCTRVKFNALSAQDIDDYWNTGEPKDKAGGYAIQGIGAKYIARLEGSYSAVMGLPIFELNQLLTESRFYE